MLWLFANDCYCLEENDPTADDDGVCYRNWRQVEGMQIEIQHQRVQRASDQACIHYHHKREDCCRISMGSLQSAILGFGIFRLLERSCSITGLTVEENVILQTTAVATATMPLAAGESIFNIHGANFSAGLN